MSHSWYYVVENERKGPVAHSDMAQLITSSQLGMEDYVWRKGFENWMKLRDVQELNSLLSEESSDFSLSALDPESKCVFIRTGSDRGGLPQDYGPFSLNILKKLAQESRINSKTLIYTKGLPKWAYLGEVSGYQEIFEDVPPVISDAEKRANKRKPFVARILFHNSKKLYEGLCRDISIGGMQILVAHFPGKVGEEISMNVHPENEDYHFVASGKIVRLLEGNQGFSFRFTDLADEAKTSILNYIKNE